MKSFSFKYFSFVWFVLCVMCELCMYVCVCAPIYGFLMDFFLFSFFRKKYFIKCVVGYIFFVWSTTVVEVFFVLHLTKEFHSLCVSNCHRELVVSEWETCFRLHFFRYHIIIHKANSSVYILHFPEGIWKKIHP